MARGIWIVGWMTAAVAAVRLDTLGAAFYSCEYPWIYGQVTRSMTGNSSFFLFFSHFTLRHPPFSSEGYVLLAAYFFFSHNPMGGYYSLFIVDFFFFAFAFFIRLLLLEAAWALRHTQKRGWIRVDGK